jgi:glucokinase
MILGIDVGGTSVKMGIIAGQGEISAYKKYETEPFVREGFDKSLIKAINEYLVSYPGLKGIGIGFPGLLSADRRKVLMLPNIPAIKNLPIVDILKLEFPQLTIKIENDAKCAALGEYYFGDNKGLEDFLLVTLGTGVGSGAMVNKSLFIGGRGNGTEIGHMISRNGKTLEELIGLAPLVAYAKEVIASAPEGQTKLKDRDIDLRMLSEAAQKGDPCAKKVFSYMGNLLGENLVSVIRVLDVNNVLIGGGISGAFDFILPDVKSVIMSKLPPYYTDTLSIKKASLSNEAGLLGAAGLIVHEHSVA